MDATMWLWLAIGAGIRGGRLRRRLDDADPGLPAGNARMQEIAAAVQAGAKAYLNRQYTTIGIVGVVLFALLGLALDWPTAGGFWSARSSRPRRLHRHEHLGARQRAHRAGRQRGPERRAAGGVPRRRDHRHAGGRPRPARRRRRTTSSWCRRSAEDHALRSLVGLAFGGSLISIFARLGGGIFTKGADVGADLVGKVEAGIPRTTRATRR